MRLTNTANGLHVRNRASPAGVQWIELVTDRMEVLPSRQIKVS